MKTLPDRLREVREINHINQNALAKELQVQPATVSRYECGTSDPDTKTVRWYAERFNVSLDWLFGLTDNPAPRRAAQETVQAVIAGESDVSSEQAAAKLPEEYREAVIALIRAELHKHG